MNTFEQGLLKYLTAQQLETIQQKRIGIGGAGGLGSNCAMMLVRSGFKHLEIIDKDVIDASNLNRQQYFLNEIGQAKVTVTRKRLLDINPDLDITVHHLEWNESVGEKFFKGFDVIVEAFDAVQWKQRFVQYHAPRYPKVVSGVGMAGLIEKKPQRVRRVGNIYICGDLSTDAHRGHPPMAPRVTQCASLMAEVILDMALGIAPATH